MLTTVVRLLPVIVGMAAGYLLRRSAVASQADGEFVFKLVFYVCMPALMFRALSTVTITRQLAVFLLAAPAAVAAGYLGGWILARTRRLSRDEVPVLLIASMIVNSAFTLPFVQALYGPEGAARIAAFDLVNVTLTFTWAYFIAASANPAHEGGSLLLNRLLRSPPLYGIVAGGIVNLTGIRVPDPVADLAGAFGSATAVLIPLAIGILFTPARSELRRAAPIVAVRFGTGLVIGVAMVLLFGLDGMDRTIMLLLGVAPVAFVTVTFASLENLDVRLAATTLSLSLPASFVLSLAIALVSS